MNQALLDELIQWLRIPSISTGEGELADLERAATWAADKVRAAGGTAELVTIDGGNPIVVGDLKAGDPDAPTVLIYGHYDVQGVGDPAAWTSPPFEPTIRDERLYARGTADDKGNFFPLLYVACELAAEGALPVNVRVLIEGEEEMGGESVAKWVARDERGADAAIVFDSGMEDARTPAVTVGLRGIVHTHLTVRTGERIIHQGMYGGAALNALHALHAIVAAVLPDAEGRVRPELAAGVQAPSDFERESWRRLRSGAENLADVGARPVSPQAPEEFHERTGALPCVDLNYVEAGAARTVIPAEAHAAVTLRLAPGQDGEAMRAELERLLREAAPEGAELEITAHVGEPSHFDPESPALKLAGEALERACGVAPVFPSIGGSIPVVADLAAKGIPTIVSGFSLSDDAFHAPDESYRLRALELGEAASRELLAALAGLRG
ncbi:MAG: family dipeptidase [Solirubrobacteraceae bacterium]|nr:family dipeptidase [Solirubrobacteraceae bacterium]